MPPRWRAIKAAVALWALVGATVLSCGFFAGATVAASQERSVSSVGQEHGFVRRNPAEPTQLAFEDGTPFYPVGLNRWAVYVAGDNPDNQSMEEYLAAAKAAGVNTLRVFVVENNPDVPMSIEPKLGQYNEAYLERLGQLFSQAQRDEIYIILALYDHYDLRNFWSASVYSSAKGGPARRQLDFYVDPETLQYERRRIKALVERYTKWPNLLAWEPINEANGVAQNPPVSFPAIVARWVTEMAEYIKSVDPNQHLVTASLTGDNFWPAVFQSPAVDLAQVHIYQDSKNPDAIVDLVSAYYRKGQSLGKPLVVGEFGSLADNPQRLDYIHDGLWAALINGGSAFLWTHKNDPYGDVNGEILRVYRGFARVVARLHWGGAVRPRPLSARELQLGQAESGKLSAMGLRLGSQNLVWIRARHNGLCAPVVTLKNAAVGRHTVAFLDPYSGQALKTVRQTVAEEEEGGGTGTGPLTVAVTAFQGQIAILDTAQP